MSPEEYKKGLSEAKGKYQEFKEKDPYVDIPAALLNSADIIKYVERTGMIYPFYKDDKHLKPATYSIRLLGKVVYWNDKKKW